MFDRIKRSFDLVHASMEVLRHDKRLLLFPLISGVALLFVLLAFALPVFGLASVDGMHGGRAYSLGFLFYVVQYAVIFYFNTALVGAVMIHLDGGRPTLGEGLRIANSRFGTILGYAVISATIGVVLRAIQERLGFVGRFIVGLIGVGWSVASFLVVPVIVVRDRGTFGSISESAALLKRTWGENLIGQGGLGVAFGLIYFGLVFGTFAVASVVGTVAGAPGPVLLVAAAFVLLAFLFCALFHSTLSGIYSVVLYRYAADGNATPGFDGDIMAASFRRKS
jgi:hypothetical protein